MNSPHLEMRAGVVWCLTHECPWKQCPCPGHFFLRAKVSRDVIERITKQRNALTNIEHSFYGSDHVGSGDR